MNGQVSLDLMVQSFQGFSFRFHTEITHVIKVMEQWSLM